MPRKARAPRPLLATGAARKTVQLDGWNGFPNNLSPPDQQARAALISPFHTLPGGFRCRFCFNGDLTIEWAPEIPRIRSASLLARFSQEYIRCRNAFALELATFIRINVIVIDPVSGRVEVIQPAVLQ